MSHTDVERPATVSRLDYEPELVFVIGKRARYLSKEKAKDAIAKAGGTAEVVGV